MVFREAPRAETSRRLNPDGPSSPLQSVQSRRRRGAWLVKHHGEPPLSMPPSVPISELLWCHHASRASRLLCRRRQLGVMVPISEPASHMHSLIARVSNGVGNWGYHRSGELSALGFQYPPKARVSSTPHSQLVCLLHASVGYVDLSCASAQCKASLVCTLGAPALYLGCQQGPCRVALLPWKLEEPSVVQTAAAKSHFPDAAIHQTLSCSKIKKGSPLEKACNPLSGPRCSSHGNKSATVCAKYWFSTVHEILPA
jgi:hypothetical protein